MLYVTEECHHADRRLYTHFRAWGRAVGGERDVCFDGSTIGILVCDACWSQVTPGEQMQWRRTIEVQSTT